MDGAERVFAGEFAGSTLSVPDENPKNPAWVVTPGGAWCRSLFLAGALTEVVESGDQVLSRMADPTGVYSLAISRRRSSLAAAIGKIPVPSFVTVLGTAQMFVRNGTVHLSVRPDQVQPVDRTVRDQWILATARSTLRRLSQVSLALSGGSGDPRMDAVIRHYSLNRDRIRDLVGMIEHAVQAACTTPKEGGVQPDIRQSIVDLMAAENGPRGISVEEIIGRLTGRGIPEGLIISGIESLITDDECYQPQKGYIKLL